MGQAKNRGTRDERVAAAQARETAVRIGDVLAKARQREALDKAARVDAVKPPARATVVGGITPRMRLALAGLAHMIDGVGVVNATGETN